MDGHGGHTRRRRSLLRRGHGCSLRSGDPGQRRSRDVASDREGTALLGRVRQRGPQPDHRADGPNGTDETGGPSPRSDLEAAHRRRRRLRWGVRGGSLPEPRPRGVLGAGRGLQRTGLAAGLASGRGRALSAHPARRRPEPRSDLVRGLGGRDLPFGGRGTDLDRCQRRGVEGRGVLRPLHDARPGRRRRDLPPGPPRHVSDARRGALLGVDRERPSDRGAERRPALRLRLPDRDGSRDQGCVRDPPRGGRVSLPARGCASGLPDDERRGELGGPLEGTLGRRHVYEHPPGSDVRGWTRSVRCVFRDVVGNGLREQRPG